MYLLELYKQIRGKYQKGIYTYDNHNSISLFIKKFVVCTLRCKKCNRIGPKTSLFRIETLQSSLKDNTIAY